MKHEDTHATVAAAYTTAIRARQGKSSPCCQSAKQAIDKVPPTAASPYHDLPEQLEELRGASFGCGNPIALAGLGRGQTVVDLGSGAGLDLLLAAAKVGPDGHVIGIDMTDAMLDAARQAIARAGATNVEVRKGLIEELPVESESADWIVSNCVINLAPDKDRVFGEIARVLKPTGRFSISDIVVHDLPDWLRNNAASYAACVGGAISEEDYLAGLRHAGLRAVQVADRVIYDEDQLRALISAETCGFGIDNNALNAGLKAAVGKVASIRVTGSR